MTYYNKILGFIKRCFFRGLVFLSTLTSANSFSCISMNNQEWPQITNVNGDDPVLFPFSIRTSKCSGSWNNINNPCAKLCVPDAVKNLTINVFNLVLRTNETRCIEFAVFVIIKNVGIMINADANAKNSLIKV